MAPRGVEKGENSSMFGSPWEMREASLPFPREITDVMYILASSVPESTIFLKTTV